MNRNQVEIAETFKRSFAVNSKQLDRMERKLDKIIRMLRGSQQPHLSGGKFVIVVKDDNPDVAYDVQDLVVTDSEGQVIDHPNLTFSIESSDPNVVQITPNDAASTGTAHFGAPGQANVNLNVMDGEGNLLGALGAQFTVTAGDPKAITGGSLKFGELQNA